MKTILFVCTGNTCRSPMAQGLFNHLAREAGVQAEALSAGLAAYPLDPVSPKAADALRAFGVDISSHRAHPVSENLICACDRIFCFTEDQLQRLKQLFPAYAARMCRLTRQDFQDPYGGDQEIYDESAKEIFEAVKNLLRKLGGPEEDVCGG